ncbi:TetR/AcrR family transcriptional regulator [Solicola gregarius]|uniref:TetR/AcrR family transcriptional regulator n=1 Tax=Solicola gregarius TaxID=2908642 RepID=A0AA46TMM1_9ACTN|nr:TetR/AcrR family transcriptional regulator [Solicola gregarius]UYM07727.1 TetR/AcrR family transcriptional regulator [Solicola gregarius]
MSEESTESSKSTAITGALLAIVDQHGLDRVSVREVAAHAGVSIGTVQHYFPTKDAMLAAAYDEVVRRLRTRLDSVKIGGDVRKNLTLVLRELLPLDKRRVAETRIHLAFAARAATDPTLASTQQAALAEIHVALTDAFVRAWGTRTPKDTAELAAHVAIAIADGLALHAVSSGRWLTRRTQSEALGLGINAVLAVGE